MSRGGSIRVADAQTIETELMLADLESVEKRLAGLQRKIKGGDKEAVEQERLLKRRRRRSRRGGRRGRWRWPEEDARAWRLLQLLTAKPVLYVCNVEEEAAATGNAFSAAVATMAAAEGDGARGDLGRDRGGDRAARRAERAEFLETMGLEEAGLDRLIRAGYGLLGLPTYFTVGPKEARAWTIRQGASRRRRRA